MDVVKAVSKTVPSRPASVKRLRLLPPLPPLPRPPPRPPPPRPPPRSTPTNHVKFPKKKRRRPTPANANIPKRNRRKKNYPPNQQKTPRKEVATKRVVPKENVGVVQIPCLDFHVSVHLQKQCWRVTVYMTR